MQSVVSVKKPTLGRASVPYPAPSAPARFISTTVALTVW
jgi:hypothetical protein